DAAYPRICTYGLFKHIDCENTFWVFNTHLDHQGVESRRQGVQLILNKIITLNNQNRPYILMGDLNASPESEVITTLSNRLDDSRLVSKINFGPEGTFNDFDHQRPVNRRIDYIMLSKEPKISVEKYGTLSSTIDLRFPSDHFPVYVELTLN
ncbi:MAG: endonuclease/exonuclease/phosphatase family protein, partial [Marinoscillum sp.]